MLHEFHQSYRGRWKKKHTLSSRKRFRAIRLCSENECTNVHFGHGMCSHHYYIHLKSQTAQIAKPYMLYKCVSEGGPFTFGKYYPLSVIHSYGNCFITFAMPFRLSSGIAEKDGWRVSFEVWYLPFRKAFTNLRHARQIYRCWRVNRVKRQMTPVWAFCAFTEAMEFNRKRHHGLVHDSNHKPLPPLTRGERYNLYHEAVRKYL